VTSDAANSEVGPLERHVRSTSDSRHRQVVSARPLRATSGHWSARFVIFIPSDADCDDRPADWISERKKLEPRGDYI
jgi:hypothetical protein